MLRLMFSETDVLILTRAFYNSGDAALCEPYGFEYVQRNLRFPDLEG